MPLRKLALGFAAAAAGAIALTTAALAFTRLRAGASEPETPQPLRTDAADGPAPSYAQFRDPISVDGDGHAAPDLGPDATPATRVPPAFRPDMDAPMSEAEREALRPATGPSPTLVDAGTSLPAGH